MSLRKTWAVLVKETRHIQRDPGTWMLLLLAPPLLLIIMSYAVIADIREVPIMVMDNDRSDLSRRLLATLTNSQDIIVDRIVTNYAEAEQHFARNQSKALVVIPPHFAGRLSAGRPVDVQVIVDGTDPTTADHVINQVVSRSQVFGIPFIRPSGSSDVNVSLWPGIDLRTRTWYNPDLKNTHGIIPAIMAVVMSLPAMVVMNAIVREKEQSTLETIFATPLGRGELLLGKLIPYIFMGLFSVILCILVAISLFGVPFRGSFWLFMLLATLFLLALYSTGLFLATFLSNQAAASLSGLLLFLFPGFFLSGIFYPVESFPTIVQEEADWLPVTHFVSIARGLMVKGQGLEALVRPTLMLLELAGIMTALALFFFKKRLK